MNPPHNSNPNDQESPELISASNSSAFSATFKNRQNSNAPSARSASLNQRVPSIQPPVSSPTTIPINLNINIITLLEHELSTNRKIPEPQITSFLRKLFPIQQSQTNTFISLYRSIVQYMSIMFNKESSGGSFGGLYGGINSDNAKYMEIVKEIVKTARFLNEDLAVGVKYVLERPDVKQKILKTRLKSKDVGNKPIARKEPIDLLSSICLKPKQADKINADKVNFDFRGNYTKQSELFKLAEINIKQKSIIKDLLPDYRNNSSLSCVLCDRQVQKNSHHTFKCEECGKLFHKSCNPRKYNCVFCQLKSINPLREVEEQLFVGVLRKNTKRHEILFEYNYDESKVESLVPPKFKNFGVNMNFQKPMTIEVRSLRIKEYYDPNASYITLFPDACSISINNRLVKEFIPLHKQSSLKYRRDETVKLATNLNVRKGTNTISIVQRFLKRDLKPEERVEPQNHLIGIYLLKQPNPTPKELIKKYETLSLEESQTLLKQSLLMDDDKFLQSKNNKDEQPELACENTKISLMCSLTLLKMVYPGRSIFCTHFTCFDIYNFIMLNSQSNIPKWQCPICKVPAYKFKFDPIVKGVLELTSKPEVYGLQNQKNKKKKEWTELVLNREMKFMALDEENNEGEILSIYDLPIEQKYKRKFERPFEKEQKTLQSIIENKNPNQQRKQSKQKGYQKDQIEQINNVIQNQLLLNTSNENLNEIVKEKMDENRLTKQNISIDNFQNGTSGAAGQIQSNQKSANISEMDEEEKIMELLVRAKEEELKKKIRNQGKGNKMEKKNLNYISTEGIEMFAAKASRGQSSKTNGKECKNKLKNSTNECKDKNVPFMMPQDCEIVELSD